MSFDTYRTHFIQEKKRDDGNLTYKFAEASREDGVWILREFNNVRLSSRGIMVDDEMTVRRMTSHSDKALCKHILEGYERGQTGAKIDAESFGTSKWQHISRM
ncbi:MAG: hypothetical protein H6867_05920 [Rhodospirillales bacterium]|nr:hypothetical protein [Rhodospirillales bacterium]MCB9995065.1 hypothetical protein [Rhodospirillales bacterium]